MPETAPEKRNTNGADLLMSERASRLKRLSSFLLESFLFIVTAVSMVSVLFIVFFIARDALPFFKSHYDNFHGAIDEVGIWNRPLSDEEMYELYTKDAKSLQNGLLAFYPLDGDGLETTGKGKPGQLKDAEPTSDRFGKNGKALLLNGDNAWIKVDPGTNLSIKGEQDLTLGAWINPEEISIGKTMSVIARWGVEPGDTQFCLCIRDGKPMLSLALPPEKDSEGAILPKAAELAIDYSVDIKTWSYLIARYDAKSGDASLTLLNEKQLTTFRDELKTEIQYQFPDSATAAEMKPAELAAITDSLNREIALVDAKMLFDGHNHVSSNIGRTEFGETRQPLEIGRNKRVLSRFAQFFTSTKWYPTQEPPIFGTLSILFGTLLVTLGAVLFAVPVGVAASITLSDVLPFNIRQMVKPVIEVLAAIPSVAYGFFALVIFAPLLQSSGGKLLTVTSWVVFAPVLAIGSLVVSDLLAGRMHPNNEKKKKQTTLGIFITMSVLFIMMLILLSDYLLGLKINSGTNALNVSIILGLMALPTIVSVSEDALQAVGRELREGSYALGATRAETLMKVVLPAASSGIIAAIILGMMRAVGETMVVWMASGNAAQIPTPIFNYLEPIRTMTATIAGEMGEAARGTPRYFVLFAMALVLLIISFISNLVSEWIVVRARKKLKGA